MWWKVLGVSKDADLNTVKKAYSDLIKQYRPEDHPEEFSQIRHAFEEARKQAKKSSIPAGDKVFSVELEKPQTPSIKENSADNNISNQAIQAQIQQNVVVIEADASPDNHEGRKTEDDIDKAESDKVIEKPVIEILEEWKSTAFKNSVCIDEILGHSTTHEYFNLLNTGHEIFNWLIDNVKIAPGFLSTKINVPEYELARMDKLFGWSLRERELYLQHPGMDLSLIFFGIASAQCKNQYKNTAILNKASKEIRQNNKSFISVVEIMTGYVFVGLLIALIAPIGKLLQNQEYWWVLFLLLLCVIFIDVFKYSFAGLTKIGVIKERSKKSTLIKFYIKNIVSTLILITVLAIVIFIPVGFEAILIKSTMEDLSINPAKLLFIAILMWVVFWLCRESYILMKNRLLKFITDRIMLINKFR